MAIELKVTPEVLTRMAQRCGHWSLRERENTDVYNIPDQGDIYIKTI